MKRRNTSSIVGSRQESSQFILPDVDVDSSILTSLENEGIKELKFGKVGLENWSCTPLSKKGPENYKLMSGLRRG